MKKKASCSFTLGLFLCSLRPPHLGVSEISNSRGNEFFARSRDIFPFTASTFDSLHEPLGF